MFKIPLKKVSGGYNSWHSTLWWLRVGCVYRMQIHSGRCSSSVIHNDHLLHEDKTCSHQLILQYLFNPSCDFPATLLAIERGVLVILFPSTFVLICALDFAWSAAVALKSIVVNVCITRIYKSWSTDKGMSIWSLSPK